MFFRLLILLTANPEPLDQGDVAYGRLEIPVWGLESEHAFTCLKKGQELNTNTVEKDFQNMLLHFTQNFIIPHRYRFAVVLGQD